jgi:hypothetical protein
MAHKRGAVVTLVTGAVCILAGVTLGISSLFPLAHQFEPLATLQSPGSLEIVIADAGPHTLWHDRRTTFESTAHDNPATLPPDFTFRLTRSGTGSDGEPAITLDPVAGQYNVTFGRRQSVAVGTFDLATPGRYLLEVTNPSGDARIFSLTRGSFLHGLAASGVRIALGLILGVGGLVLLVLGIVFLARGAGARTGPPSAPSFPPPPPVAPPR